MQRRQIPDDVIQQIYTAAKAGNVNVHELSQLIYRTAPYTKLGTDVLMVRWSMFGRPAMSDEATKEEMDHFVDCLKRVFVDGALRGLIDGNYHHEVCLLLDYLRSANYYVGKSQRQVEGVELGRKLCEIVAREYVQQGKITTAREAALILSKMPYKNIRIEIKSSLPSALRPANGEPTVRMFRMPNRDNYDIESDYREDYKQVTRMHLIDDKTRHAMEEKSDQMFKL